MMRKTPIEWMKSFDFQLTDGIYLCHGTPTNDLIYLLENVEIGYAKIIELLKGKQSSLIF